MVCAEYMQLQNLHLILSFAVFPSPQDNMLGRGVATMGTLYLSIQLRDDYDPNRWRKFHSSPSLKKGWTNQKSFFK